MSATPMVDKLAINSEDNLLAQGCIWTLARQLEAALSDIYIIASAEQIFAVTKANKQILNLIEGVWMEGKLIEPVICLVDDQPCSDDCCFVTCSEKERATKEVKKELL